jgi:hypothetical protein
MWSFVTGNQCPAGTTISKVDKYKLLNWSEVYSDSQLSSIYISPSSGNSYLNAYIQTDSGINTAVVKFDSSDNQIWARYYPIQYTLSHGLAVDSTETYMYLADSGGDGIEIVKATCFDGTVEFVFKQ